MSSKAFLLWQTFVSDIPSHLKFYLLSNHIRNVSEHLSAKQEQLDVVVPETGRDHVDLGRPLDGAQTIVQN